MDANKNQVLVAGFAQFPKGTPVYELHKVIGCILIIDKKTDIIIEATFTFVKDITANFASSLIKGKSVKNGIDELIQEIETRFLVPGQRAVIQSFISAYERYCETKQT